MKTSPLVAGLLLAVAIVVWAAPWAGAGEVDDLGDFAFPLEYAEGEAEGRGLMCPSLVPTPGRVLFVVRQEMALSVQPKGAEARLRLWIPAFRNFGEQRRLASRVRVLAGGRSLEHEAALVYSEPHNNPFLRIDVRVPKGDVTAQVDSWLSHAAPPADPARTAARIAGLRYSRAKADAFNERYAVPEIRHWCGDVPGLVNRGPAIVKADGDTPLARARDAVKRTPGFIRFANGRPAKHPQQVIRDRSGNAGSRSSLLWFALQDEMPCYYVAGYARAMVETEWAGGHAWNAMACGGMLIADAQDKESYFGPDQANYLATCVGDDHVLEEIPALPRHQSYTGGLYLVFEGSAEVRHYTRLAATSSLARVTTAGKVTISRPSQNQGGGEAAGELNAQLREAPPGIVKAAMEIDRERKRINPRR